MGRSRRLADLPASTGPRRLRCVVAFMGLILLAAGSARAQTIDGPRSPLGVYAHFDVETAIGQLLANVYPRLTPPPCYVGLPAGVQAVVHQHLRKLYTGLLKNKTAVSGIALGVHWCLLQPYNPACIGDSCNGLKHGIDWSYLADVFDSLGPNQNVQLIVTPGVDAPPWMMDKLASCDGLFPPPGGGFPAAEYDCGKVTFSVFPEQSHGDSSEFPMPWSVDYNSYWRLFLGDLYARYKDVSGFVSIAVAGPVGASTEMILPTTANYSYLWVAATSQSTEITPLGRVYLADRMWQTLIDNALKGTAIRTLPNYKEYEKHPEQVFVDSWNATIDAYQEIFSGVTLTLTPDSGTDIDLPLLGGLPAPADALDAADIEVFGKLLPKDCVNISQPVPCQAKVEVLSHFVNSKSAGAIPNENATQVGGMTAGSPTVTGDIGVPGVKLLTSWLESALQPAPPSLPFLGGSEFDFSVSVAGTIAREGCVGKLPCSTPEEAAYNVLNTFFSCTSYGAQFGAKKCTDATLSSAQPVKIQYVDLNYNDIQYAQANSCPPKAFESNAGPPWTACTSLEDLLNFTRYDLLTLAGKQPEKEPVATCEATAPPCQ